jgi:hypothetical protein
LPATELASAAPDVTVSLGCPALVRTASASAGAEQEEVDCQLEEALRRLGAGATAQEKP